MKNTFSEIANLYYFIECDVWYETGLISRRYIEKCISLLGGHTPSIFWKNYLSIVYQAHCLRTTHTHCQPL